MCRRLPLHATTFQWHVAHCLGQDSLSLDILSVHFFLVSAAYFFFIYLFTIYFLNKIAGSLKSSNRR